MYEPIPVTQKYCYLEYVNIFTWIYTKHYRPYNSMHQSKFWIFYYFNTKMLFNSLKSAPLMWVWCSNIYSILTVSNVIMTRPFHQMWLDLEDGYIPVISCRTNLTRLCVNDRIHLSMMLSDGWKVSSLWRNTTSSSYKV